MFNQKYKGHVLKSLCMSLGLILSLMFLFIACHKNAAELEWLETTRECRPWAYWWWMGSAVDKPNQTVLLKEYAKVGRQNLIESFYSLQTVCFLVKIYHSS